MKIGIVDDVANDRKELIDVILLLFHDYNMECEICEFDSGEAFLEKFSVHEYDLCFLDIYMDGMNGMETAKVIAKQDPGCFLIFLTTSPDFIVEGYDVRAWRYLLKPITTTAINKALIPWIEQFQLSQQCLTITYENNEIKIPYYKLYYIRVVGRNVEVHLQDDYLTLSSKVTFTEITKPLQTDNRFILCDKGTIIAISKIQTIQKNEITLDNLEIVYVSRRKLSELRAAFLQYTISSMS